MTGSTSSSPKPGASAQFAAPAESDDETLTTKVSVVPLPRPIFIRRLDDLIWIHLLAMDYPATTFRQRKSLWRSNIDHPEAISFCAVLHQTDVAPDPADLSQPIVGVCFSFRGGPRTWWYRQIAAGLIRRGMSREETLKLLSDYAEISEVHVAPAYQNRGIGSVMLEGLLATVSADKVMLSTPEVPNEENAAWGLYRKYGFYDLLRHFQFPADSREFGILCRDV